MIGAYEENRKLICGNTTKFALNSVISTFNAPSNLIEAVREEIT